MLPQKLKIVCLCGSSKFKEEFDEIAQVFTYHGWIVLTMAYFTHYEKTRNNQNLDKFIAIKEKLDELHKRKIDLADLVFVINPGNYIGDSTRNEIVYAIKWGKAIAYLNQSIVNLNQLVLK